MGGSISGGEQQMLTMCRCLMGDPAFMMIDEPTEGLSPQMVEKVSKFSVNKRVLSFSCTGQAGPFILNKIY